MVESHITCPYCETSFYHPQSSDNLTEEVKRHVVHSDGSGHNPAGEYPETFDLELKNILSTYELRREQALNPGQTFDRGYIKFHSGCGGVTSLKEHLGGGWEFFCNSCRTQVSEQRVVTFTETEITEGSGLSIEAFARLPIHVREEITRTEDFSQAQEVYSECREEHTERLTQAFQQTRGVGD